MRSLCEVQLGFLWARIRALQFLLGNTEQRIFPLHGTFKIYLERWKTNFLGIFRYLASNYLSKAFAVSRLLHSRIQMERNMIKQQALSSGMSLLRKSKDHNIRPRPTFLVWGTLNIIGLHSGLAQNSVWAPLDMVGQHCPGEARLLHIYLWCPASLCLLANVPNIPSRHSAFHQVHMVRKKHQHIIGTNGGIEKKGKEKKP